MKIYNNLLKNKTVAVYVTNPSRISDRNDQYDSFRAEGRIVINIGFGLGVLGFNVHIIYLGWSNDLRQIYKNVYLTNKPRLDYYDYALVFQNTPNPSSKYGTVIFMGYEHYSIRIYNEYKNNINKNTIYAYLSNMNFDKVQSNIPFKIYYLPMLFPIPLINTDEKFGFLPYHYEPKLPILNVFMFFSSNSLSTDFNKVRFLDKEIFIINYLKNNGFILNLNVLVENKEHMSEFPIDKFVDKNNKNETQHKIKISFSNESSYRDIINYIEKSDVCITVGGFSSGNCLMDMISLGKPTIFIGDGVEEKSQREIIKNAIYKCPEEILYIQESNKDSLKKIEKFMLNPKTSYDKFKDAHKDFDFNNWREIVMKYFTINENKKSKNVTKETLVQLLKYKPPKIEIKEPESKIVEETLIVSTNQDSNINQNLNTIYINEYWNLESLTIEDNVVPFLECIKMWRCLKVNEQCYFDYNNTNLTLDKIEMIKNIFEKAGFQCITINSSESKIEFIKLSITKIRNWEYLRYIHELLDNENITYQTNS